MKKRSVIIGVCAGLCIWLMAGLWARAPADGGPYHLGSAVFDDVILIRDTGIADVYVYLVFPSGEAQNPFEEGLAHYVEHLAWISAFGGIDPATDRHSNAWTNPFTTGYWSRAPAQQLPDALQRLLLVAQPIKVDRPFALQERDIILREYDYRVAERPLYQLSRDMDQLVYGHGTLARSVIGEPSVIAQYSLERAAQLHGQSHIAAQATLLVYGNIDKSGLKAALAALEKHPLGAPIAPADARPLVEHATINDRALSSVAGLSQELFIYRKLVFLDACQRPVRCAMLAGLVRDILASALPGGLGGPLRFEQFVARRFSLDLTLIGGQYGELTFTANPDHGVSLQTLEHHFHRALRQVLQHGLPQGTFDRAMARRRDHLHGLRDRPQYNFELVRDQLISGGPVFSLSDQINALEEIHLEDVNTFAKSLLGYGREVTRLVTTKG